MNGSGRSCTGMMADCRVQSGQGWGCALWGRLAAGLIGSGNHLFPFPLALELRSAESYGHGRLGSFLISQGAFAPRGHTKPHEHTHPTHNHV